MSVGVITDATGDLPADLLEQYRLPCVPHLILWGEDTLVEGVDIGRGWPSTNRSIAHRS